MSKTFNLLAVRVESFLHDLEVRQMSFEWPDRVGDGKGFAANDRKALAIRTAEAVRQKLNLTGEQGAEISYWLETCKPGDTLLMPASLTMARNQDDQDDSDDEFGDEIAITRLSDGDDVGQLSRVTVVTEHVVKRDVKTVPVSKPKPTAMPKPKKPKGGKS